MTDGKLHLKVLTPTRSVVDAEVDMVTIPGALGALGILPGHAPLLAALRIGELTYRVGSREDHLAIHKGFAEVAANEVTVLADIAELPGEIDVTRARAEMAEAEEAMKGAISVDFDKRRAKLEGAVTRITVGSRR